MDIQTKKNNLKQIMKKRLEGNTYQEQKEEVWKTVSNLNAEEKLEWVKDSLSLDENELDYYNNNRTTSNTTGPSLMETWIRNI